MDAKRFVTGVMMTLFALNGARAQGPYMAPPAPPPAVPMGGEPAVNAAPVGMPGDGYNIPGVTNWIRRGDSPSASTCNSSCNTCNGPVGKNSGIGEELYFRSGPSFPIGDAPFLSRNLAVGFVVQGGARTLFYNHEYNRAWVVDASISNTFNSGVNRGDTFLAPVVANGSNAPVTIRSVNRTFVNLGFGREWFLTPALASPSHVRLGVDGGGRWGSMKASFDQAGAFTDVIGGAYVGSHILYEFGFKDSIVDVGLRSEYSYTWSDVFRRASDVSEINLLVTLGVRY